MVMKLVDGCFLECIGRDRWMVLSEDADAVERVSSPR